MYYSYLPTSQLRGLFFPIYAIRTLLRGFVLIEDELELLGGPGYEMAERNLDMLDSLIQEVQEFYDNWTK